jgi:hypothetical protein
MTINEQILAQLDRANQALRDKGYDKAHASIMADSGWGVPYWASLHDMPPGCSRGGQGADTFDGAIDKLLATIADLPPRWSDAQVAATLGIGVAA